MVCHFGFSVLEPISYVSFGLSNSEVTKDYHELIRYRQEIETASLAVRIEGVSGETFMEGEGREKSDENADGYGRCLQ